MMIVLQLKRQKNKKNPYKKPLNKNISVNLNNKSAVTNLSPEYKKKQKKKLHVNIQSKNHPKKSNILQTQKKTELERGFSTNTQVSST